MTSIFFFFSLSLFLKLNSNIFSNVTLTFKKNTFSCFFFAIIKWKNKFTRKKGACHSGVQQGSSWAFFRYYLSTAVLTVSTGRDQKKYRKWSNTFRLKQDQIKMFPNQGQDIDPQKGGFETGLETHTSLQYYSSSTTRLLHPENTFSIKWNASSSSDLSEPPAPKGLRPPTGLASS